MSGLSAIQPTTTRAAPLEHVRTRLRQATDQLVGSVFYGTLLKTMRANGLRGKYGHGGRGEEVFAAQLDQILAERAGRARGYDLSDAIMGQLDRQVRALARSRHHSGGAS